MSSGERNISEHGYVLAELERLKRDNSYLRMRLSYLEAASNNTSTTGAKSAKLSKWHRVKGAFGWEKDKEDMLKVPNSSSDSPFSVSPAGSCLSHSSLGTHYTLPLVPHLSSSSSDEELLVQERRCVSASDAEYKDCSLEADEDQSRSCKSLDGEAANKLEMHLEADEDQSRSCKSLDGEAANKVEMHLITNNKKTYKLSKEESQPHHKTPWGKVKCMIHHHSKGSRKKNSCHQCDKKEEKWQTLLEEGNCEAEEECVVVKNCTPKLTVTLPSNEELGHDKNEKKQENSDVSFNHSKNSPLTRKSKWLKVRDVFLQGSRSAPTSPIRSECFAYDIESDEVSSGEILGEKDDEVFDVNENLRYQIEASYIELQNRLTDEFASKMEEIAHNSYMKHKFRLKKNGDTSKSVAQEVIVPTSKGLFRFEGISDKFTRRLYEWEVAKGIAPEESTIALLDPQYKPFSNKNKNNLVEVNSCIVKSKSTGSIVDLGNTNQSVLSYRRTSSLSLNDVDEIQASLGQVPDSRSNNQENVQKLNVNRGSCSLRRTSQELKSTFIDSSNRIVLSDSEKNARSGIKCRQMVDSSYQLLQENISLLDKLKKERDVCRQLEDDMIHLEGQIHDVSKSFENEIVGKIEVQANPNDININSFEFGSNYIDSSHLDLNIQNNKVHQVNLDIANFAMKLDPFPIEKNIFHDEPERTQHNRIYHHPDVHHGIKIPAEEKTDSVLINGIIAELLDMAKRLEASVVERETEIFQLKNEIFRKEMGAFHRNEIRSYFSSFTLPIHWLRGRRSQELSRLPKQIMDKLLELKQAFILANAVSCLGDLGQNTSSPHSLRRCVGHEDLSPEPAALARSTASSPASSFSFHGSYNDTHNDWISISSHNHAISHDIKHSDWLIIRDEHSSYTDLASEGGVSVKGSLVNVTNVLVPTTRKIFSPIGDSKVIEYVIGEDFPEKRKTIKETETPAKEEESKLEITNSEESGEQEASEWVNEIENEILFSDKNNNSASYQNLVFMENSAETRDIGVEALTIGEELSCSLKMRALKIQKAKEEFLCRTCTGSLSIVVESLNTDLSNKLVVKSASASEIAITQYQQGTVVPKTCENVASQTKPNKLSLLGIFKRSKRKSKEGAVATLARQSLTLTSEPAGSSHTKSCPSSPVLSKRSDSNWIKNPAKMIFRPKGKYMINGK